MGKHLPAIDGLRAVAVLSVVAYHAGLPLAAGYVGVDVFFVISGYVITRMLLAEPQIDLAAFYARRVRRILPALLVVVGTVLALSSAFLGAVPQEAVSRSAMAAMVMLPNVWFQHVTGGYWDATVHDMPLLHLWSLGVEEQFYLLWPLLLIAFRRKPWALVVLALASLGLAEHWVSVNREVAFYQMPTRFWELALGGLVAFAPKSQIGTIAAPLGLLVLGWSITNEPQDFPGLGAAFPVFGTALVLYAVHSGTRIAPLEWKPVRYIGLVSYSFYLWHWPLLALYRGIAFDQLTVQTGVALCAIAFVLACLSYHFVELPFRRTNPPKVRAIALGVTACLAMVGCAAAVKSTVPRYDRLSEIALDVPKYGCFYEPWDAVVLPDCEEGEVVLWGDSHAYMWRPVAEQFGTVYQATRSGCGPVSAREDCAAFNALVLPRARQAKVVVLAANWAVAGTDIAATLASLPGKVIVMGPLPERPYLPLKCFGRGRPERCDVARKDFDARVESLRQQLRAQVAKHPNAIFVDPTDYFCTADVCPTVKDGIPLFRDLDHITHAAAKAYATSVWMDVRMAEESAL